MTLHVRLESPYGRADFLVWGDTEDDEVRQALASIRGLQDILGTRLAQTTWTIQGTEAKTLRDLDVQERAARKKAQEEAVHGFTS